MELPDTLAAAGLAARPLTYGDAEAVFEVITRQELHDSGSVEIDLADIVSDWQRPSFNIADSTVAVFDGETLIGYAEVMGGQRGDAAVDPAYRGRGIGTFLALWMQETARARGHSWIRMPVLAGSAGDLLLEALGYRIAWTAWLLTLPPDVEVEPRSLPTGFAMGSATPEDYRAVWAVVEDAFLEWDVRDRDSFEDFLAETRDRPGFEPWHLRVVTDPAGSVIAAAILQMSEAREDEPLEAFLDKIAVRRDLRGRGIAQALLADSFRVAREHGAVRSGLSTDSRSGALGLYENVGLKVSSTWVNRAIDL